MSTYQHSLRIEANPAQVFDYVSDVRNLPDYLPTVRHAEPQGNDRVEIEGNASGHEYANDGFFKIDKEQRRMECLVFPHF
ncbi:MAG TPA: SRPBCC family protein [Blastocatellia bacterium]|nr:SRPBCC family protein [Blastocatellia bacterium]